jgi:DNA repair exonuclease SbcCD ATPase subunit
MSRQRSPLVLLLLLLVLSVSAFALPGVAGDATATQPSKVQVEASEPAALDASSECAAQQSELDEHKRELESTKEDHGKLLAEVLIMRDEYATLVSKLSAEREKTQVVSAELEEAKASKSQVTKVRPLRHFRVRWMK